MEGRKDKSRQLGNGAQEQATGARCRARLAFLLVELVAQDGRHVGQLLGGEDAGARLVKGAANACRHG